MKPNRSFQPHLALTRTALPPGAEWSIDLPGWRFFCITSGVAYWLNPRTNSELIAGSALLVSARAGGVIRASQLGEVCVHFFNLDPGRLSTFLTWGEQQALERVATQEAFSARVFLPTTPVAEQFRELCAQRNRSTLPVRLKLLALFIEALGTKLWEDHSDLEQGADAKLRLAKLLNDTPAIDLLELTFGELVRHTRCTPRHLSRVFRELVGTSFREKQAQLRLVRAQELLATTETKIVDVALESGYRSLSFFNLMFKRRFGLTPAQWRTQTNLRASGQNPEPRYRVEKADAVIRILTPNTRVRPGMRAYPVTLRR